MSEKVSKLDKYLPSDLLPKILQTTTNARDRAYILFHIETGLRVRDVVYADWSHLNLEDCKIYVYDWKKNTWRWVYFSTGLKPHILLWKKEQDLSGKKSPRIFPFCEKTANRIIKRACAKAGFKYIPSTHWLRKTFVRLSRRAGRDIVAVQQNTGDTYKTLLEWYEGYSSEDLRKELDTKPIINY